MTMSALHVRAALVRHWEHAADDQDATLEICADDAVLEFPQSGERFVGVENFREWRRLYPSELAFRIREIRGRDDLRVAENLISYDGDSWQFTVNVLEFRDGKVVRETIYISGGWEAPEWRSGGDAGQFGFVEGRLPLVQLDDLSHEDGVVIRPVW
jgi:ketosteroid isomerase-like protein